MIEMENGNAISIEKYNDLIKAEHSLQLIRTIINDGYFSYKDDILNAIRIVLGEKKKEEN